MKKIKNKKTEKVKFRIPPVQLLFIALSVLFFTGAYLQAQTISTTLFGQNAWMPDSIGTHKWSGKLTNNWQKVKQSHCVSVRIGGIGYDKITSSGGPATTHQLLVLIDSIKLNGGEPIVQIDYADGDSALGALSSTQAHDLVYAINITNSKKVKYWTIGNEPNGQYTKGIPAHNTAAGIAAYTKTFSTAMKRADPSILIIAPEISYYDSGILTSLLSSGSSDITGSSIYGTYADYISFHFYPFDRAYALATRDSIINHITAPSKFKSNLDALNVLINAANIRSSRTTNPLKIGITEANMVNTNDIVVVDTALSGISANSFIAGQFLAEMMEYCMQDSVQFLNFWSVIEGASQNSATDKGYLRQVDASKRSTWWHFSMLANNFNGKYCKATTPYQSGGTRFFKAFGSYNGTSPIAVLVMNQRATGSNYTYTVRLGTGTVGGTGNVKFNIPGPGLAKEYTDTIVDQSTTLLVFNPSGNIVTKTRYKLSDGYGPPQNPCLSPITYANQAAYQANSAGVYQSILIGGGTNSGTISLVAGTANNNIFQAATITIAITGAGNTFSSNGKTLSLIPIPSCQ